MDETAATTRTSRPAVIAHRAVGRAAPENTLAGLAACLQDGLTWAEADVRRTRDGRHVLFHDETLERLTGAAGRLADHTYEELRALPVRGAAGSRARVPLLREALDLVRGRGSLYLDCCAIEPGQLITELRAAACEDTVLVCAYGPMVDAVRATGSRVRLVLEAREWGPALAQHLETLAPVVLEVRGNGLTAELAAGAAAAGVPWICLALGTADRAEVWRRAAQLGATWIMSDRPLAVHDELHGANGE